MHPADYTLGNAAHDGWGDQDIFGWPEQEAEADTSCSGGVSAAHPHHPALLPYAETARPAPVAAPPEPKRSAPSQAGEAGGPPRQGRSDESAARSRLYPDPTHIQVGPR